MTFFSVSSGHPVLDLAHKSCSVENYGFEDKQKAVAREKFRDCRAPPPGSLSK
jgi:hypothetical protein